MSLLDVFVNLFGGHGEYGDYVVVDLEDGGFVQATADVNGDGVIEVKCQTEVTEDMGFKPRGSGNDVTYQRKVHCKSESDARDVARVAKELARNAKNVEVGWW